MLHEVLLTVQHSYIFVRRVMPSHLNTNVSHELIKLVLNAGVLYSNAVGFSIS